MALAYGLLAFVGMLANLIILYVLIDEHRASKRKTASSYFVLSLCLARVTQIRISVLVV